MKSMYGVICICVSVCMCVFVWISKTYFGLQREVRMHVRISNLFSRYLGGRSKMGIKPSMSIMYKGVKGANDWECMKKGSFSFMPFFHVFYLIFACLINTSIL